VSAESDTHTRLARKRGIKPPSTILHTVITVSGECTPLCVGERSASIDMLDRSPFHKISKKSPSLSEVYIGGGADAMYC
jgi:hypothetical protein